MNAMILAAGFATRLRPLSLVRPKVLVPICNRPLLDILLSNLAAAQFTRIHINTHHLGDRITSYLRHNEYQLEVTTYHEDDILGTGGGIHRMAELGGINSRESVLIINGDILAGIDLQRVWEYHHESDAAVTMVMTDLPEYNKVLVDHDLSILGFREGALTRGKDKQRFKLMAFTGIHVVKKDILEKYFPAKKFFSILETYENAIAAGEKVKALFIPGLAWQEVGSVDGYWEAHCRLMTNPSEFSPWIVGVQFPCIDKTAHVHSSVRIRNICCVGKDSFVEADVCLENTILWDEVKVEKGVNLENVIVCDQTLVKKSQINRIILSDD